jgi:hypothetical protein
MGYSSIRRLRLALGAMLLLLGLALQPASAAPNPPFGSYLLSCKNVQVQSLLGGSGANLVANCRTNDGRYVTSMLPVDCDGDIANNNGQLRCMGLTPSNQPPFGSYQLSCNGIYMTGPILHASCLNRNGRAWETTLNVLGCKGDIANQNGQLSCQGAANQIPAGSYQQSCNGAYMTGPVLRAKCRDQSGRMVQAELNVLGCRQDIANMNGYLTCQGNGYGSIIVFAGIGWQGQSRTIQYAIPNLQALGFSNVIQSIAIAQGTWEFCTAPYFSGRCEKLNHGVGNLNKMGMANQISSIRPLR